MSTKYSWVKLHHSSLNDAKVCKLSDGAYRLFTRLLIVASQEEERDGIIPLGDNLEQVLFDLRIDADTFHLFANEIADSGIITYTDDAIDIRNFGKYQGADNSTERVRQFRLRQKEQSQKTQNRHETGMKHNETRMKHDETPETLDKERDKEEDQEREGEEIASSSPSYATTYAHPPADSTDGMLHETITQISTICSQTYSHKTEDAYVDLAYELIGWDVKPGDFAVFEEYWNLYSFYDQKGKKAALKTISQQWRYAMEWHKNGRPVPESAKPKVDKQEVVSSIANAVRKHGRNRFQDAKTSLGEKWGLVQKMGGWYSVCDLPEDKLKFEVFAALGETVHAV